MSENGMSQQSRFDRTLEIFFAQDHMMPSNIPVLRRAAKSIGIDMNETQARFVLMAYAGNLRGYGSIDSESEARDIVERFTDGEFLDGPFGPG